MEKEKLTPLVINIEKETLKNNFYRRVLYTDTYSQTVLMSIPVSEEIGFEKHSASQSIRIEKGQGLLQILDPNNSKFVLEYDLFDGFWMDIPPGTYHNIKNVSSNDPLKLYTKYAPPVHIQGLTEMVKPEE